MEFVSTKGMNDMLLRVKSAVSSKDLVAYLTHYYVHDGTITATDGRLVACTPFSDDREYLVPADEFEKGLAIVGDDGKISVKDDSIVISGHRRRVTIQTLNAEMFMHLLPEGDRIELPGDFVPAAEELLDFVSDDATRPWAGCIIVSNEQLFATNNVILAFREAKVNLPDMLIPKWIIEFISKHPLSPTHYSFTGSQLCFYYSDGSWVRSVLVVGEVPTIVYSLVKGVPLEAGGVAITDDWRAAYETVIALSEDEIEVTPDKLTGGKRHANVEVDIESAIEESAKWHPKYMTLVLAAATHWDLSLAPNPSPWWGPNIRGLIVGRR